MTEKEVIIKLKRKSLPKESVTAVQRQTFNRVGRILFLAGVVDYQIITRRDPERPNRFKVIAI